MLPRTSLYCTTVSQNSIIPVQIFTLRWLFFHFTLYLSFSLWPIPVSDWLGIYHLQVRLLRWFSSAWKGFLWTLFRNFSFNNIPSMFCLFRCWSFVYKTLECLQRNFILSFFSVLFELELLKQSSQFQFIYGILKRHTSVSIAKHGAFISLMLCRSDTIKKMSFGLTSYLSHFLYSDSQIKARLFKATKKEHSGTRNWASRAFYQ